MFKLENIEFGYEEKKQILKNINLEIKKGKIYIVMGENGSGKSTLLMLLKGINKVTKGNLFFNNQLINKKKEREILNLKVGYVFQDPDIQLIGPDVESDVEFGPLNLEMSLEEVKKNANYAMKECDILHLKNKNPHKLSYGEKRRVAIAGILAMQTEILILDEPTTWLDPFHQNKLIEIIKNLNSKGKTIILSTHDINFAKNLKGNYLFLKDGKILREGDIELFKDKELLISCRLI